MATLQQPQSSPDSAGPAPGGSPFHRRRRWGLAVLLAAPLVVGGLLPTIVARTPLLAWGIGTAARWDGSVTVQRASLGWFSPVVLEGIELRDSQDQPFLELAGLASQKTLWQILSSFPAAGSFRLERPKLTLLVRRGGSNLEDLLAKYQTAEGGPRRIAFALQIVDGSMTVVDVPSEQSWEIQKIEVALDSSPGMLLPERLELAATVANLKQPGSLRIRFEQQPREAPSKAASPAVLAPGQTRGQLHLEAEAVPAAMLQQLAGRLVPELRLSGELGSKLDLQWVGTDQVGTDGELSVASLTFGSRQLGRDTVRWIAAGWRAAGPAGRTGRHPASHARLRLLESRRRRLAGPPGRLAELQLEAAERWPGPIRRSRRARPGRRWLGHVPLRPLSGPGLPGRGRDKGPQSAGRQPVGKPQRAARRPDGNGRLGPQSPAGARGCCNTHRGGPGGRSQENRIGAGRRRALGALRRALVVGPNVRVELQPAARVAAQPGRSHSRLHPPRRSSRIRRSARALKFIAPVLADTAGAQGSFSIELDDYRIPLAHPQKVRSPDGSWCSHWRLHPAHWSASSARNSLTQLEPVRLKPQSVIPFRMVGGRIYHEGLELRFSDLTIRTSRLGRARPSLALLAEMPVPPKWVASMPVAASLGNLVLGLPITGTLRQPRLDRNELAKAGRQLLGRPPAAS